MKVTDDYIFGKTPIQYQLVETIHSFRMERKNKNTCIKIFILIIHDSSWKHSIYEFTKGLVSYKLGSVSAVAVIQGTIYVESEDLEHWVRFGYTEYLKSSQNRPQDGVLH